MAAPVDIANLALTLMGADPITSLDDQVKRARVMKANYDLVRKAELRSNNWAFAIVRASLPALVSVPTWGFNLEYQLPVDCLRVVQVSEFWVGLVTDDYIGSDTSTYKIEGRKIRSNLAAPLPVRYVSDVTDASQFDAAFLSAFAHRLATVTCHAITESSSKKQSIEVDYVGVIGTASRMNAFETPPEAQPDNAWIASRI